MEIYQLSWNQNTQYRIIIYDNMTIYQNEITMSVRKRCKNKWIAVFILGLSLCTNYVN